jgi:hypothetical protein
MRRGVAGWSEAETLHLSQSALQNHSSLSPPLLLPTALPLTLPFPHAGFPPSHPLDADEEVQHHIALRDQLDVRHEEVGAADSQQGIQELGLAAPEEVAVPEGL